MPRSSKGVASPPKEFPSKLVAGKTRLPGFGRALNDVSLRALPNALSRRSMKKKSVMLPLITLRELAMLHLMDDICSKPNWHVKVNDPKIVKKWKKETLKTQEDFSEAMIDWCIAEVRHRATAVTDPDHPPPCFIFNGDVYRSDTAVSPELKADLQQAVADFEAKIPEKERDWHPGSDEQVWDLVHPSLFPLVYGLTRVLPDKKKVSLEDCIARCGEGVVAPVPDDAEVAECGVVIEDDMVDWHRFSDTRISGKLNFPNPYSKKFQWLPCEVDISGNTARITSYINNLHPVEDRALYGVIERVIDAAIPLWELTLGALHALAQLGPDGDADDVFPCRIECGGPNWDLDVRWLEPGQGPERKEGEGSLNFEARQEIWVEEHKKPIYPEPHSTFRPDLVERTGPLDLRNYKNATLQVIVKLANIHLAPDDPYYPGGSWHVEGQLNERIVATALYYYSNENITQSKLRFRQQVDASVDFGQKQFDTEFLSDFFGCENYRGGVQDLGGVNTDEGRLLTFPNILQHRVDPFELEDDTKPGHRKIVALFLVDPGLKVISTANVPCQRKDWWWDEVNAPPRMEEVQSQRQPAGLEKLPLELKDAVYDAIEGFPIGWEEAMDLRLDLIDERKALTQEQGDAFLEETAFSLCEH